jgi:hypothetical protein
MKHEKTQTGNPHQLTVSQHTFPAGSISWFTCDDGRVEVYLIDQKKIIRLKPDNQLFCAKRVWDQRAESGFMKEIEDKYQTLAEHVILGNITTLDVGNTKIVTDMFAIWNIREHNRSSHVKDQKIEGLNVSRHFTKDEQELLEKNHIGVIRQDLTISGRHIAGLHIQLSLLKVRKQMQDAHWGILRASEGQFIVPDDFSNAEVLPLSPSICFFSQREDSVIKKEEVREINQLAIKSSKKYYFANVLNECPK